jgi:hypothetical protein
MNLPPHLQNLNGMMFANSNNIQLNPNNLSTQSGLNHNANLYPNDLNKITGKYKISIYKLTFNLLRTKSFSNIPKFFIPIDFICQVPKLIKQQKTKKAKQESYRKT